MLSKLTLPNELTIYTVADFHARCVSQLLAPGVVAPSGAPCPLDASAVEEIDAAGLQSLVSLANALRRQGSSLLLHKPSAALSEACVALGMAALLGEPGAQGASS
jgi:anti-anti-sigma regulatory factor